MLIDVSEYTLLPFLNHAIVLRSSVQQLFLLNPTGVQLWQALLKGETLESISQHWHNTFALDIEQARADIRQAIQVWETAGLLGAMTVTAKPAILSVPIVIPRCFYSCWHYQLNAIAIRIFCADSTVMPAVNDLLGHLAVLTTPDSAQCFYIWRVEKTFYLSQAETLLAKDSQIDTLLQHLHYAVLQMTLSSKPYLALLHAGAIAKAHQAVLMIGQSGAGKSTLTALLSHHGFAYLHDDVVLLTPDYDLISAPLPITLKQSSWDLLQAHNLDLTACSHYQRQQQTVRYWRPPYFATQAKARCLLFLEIQDHDTTAELIKLNPVESLQRLLQANSALAQPLNPTLVESLLAWIIATPAYCLRYRDLNSALTQIQNLLPDPSHE